MPDETLHLGLPYLAPAQAQKHVTHNEALRRLDTVVQLAVLDTARDAPPATPAEGDRYIVGAGATGAWAGHDGEIAAFVDGAWEIATPEDGWIAYDGASEMVLLFRDGAWAALGEAAGPFGRLGINTGADDPNRLAVRSNAALFTAIDAADGGTGDIRVVVDKETDADTATVLFQSSASGRAEIGLAGDADLVLKVSADGSAWTEAIRIDRNTGLATILYDNGASGLTAATVQAALDELAAAGGGGGGAVASVFGRTGAVVATAGDYDAAKVSFAPAGAIAATDVQAALVELDSEKAALAGATFTGAIQVTTVEVGHASDTTLARVAAGRVSVEGTELQKQPTSNGLVARTAAGSASARTLTAPAAGITVSNGDGVSGNPTLALANDLSAVEGLSSTGFAVRTATDTWTNRSVAAGTGVAVSNGSGVSGNPTVSLDIDGLSEDTAPDLSADFAATYDASAAAPKKVKGETFAALFAARASFRNLLYNPHGMVNQRNAGSGIASGSYAHDRWYALTQTSTIAVSTQSNVEDGSPAMIRLSQSQASAQRMAYAQVIEGANCRHLRGKAAVLSGRIRFSLNAAVRYAILEWTGTEDAPTKNVVNSWTNGTFTAGQFFISTNLTVRAVGSITPAANTLTDLTELTATLGSSFTNLIVMIWTEGTAAQNATLDFSLQLERGTKASEREFRPTGLEELLCQRYYWRGGANGDGTGLSWAGNTSTYKVCEGSFPVIMRAAPSGSVATAPTYSNASGATLSASANGFAVVVTSSVSGGRVGASAGVYAFDAEI